MNNFTKLILTSAVFVTSGFAVTLLDPSPTGTLPRTIESGAEVEINSSISIAQTITNRGTIKINNSTTPITISRASDDPTLMTQETAIIDNCPYIAIEKVSDPIKLDKNPSLTKNDILNANEIIYGKTTTIDGQEITESVSPENVYTLAQDTEGKTIIAETSNLMLDNTEIKSTSDSWILHTKNSFITQDENDESTSRRLDKRDLLFLGKDSEEQTVIIQGEEDDRFSSHINCHFGNTIKKKDGTSESEYATPYNLEIQKFVYMAGNVEHYQGNVTLENTIDEITPTLAFAFEANVIPETMNIKVKTNDGELRFTSTKGKVNSNIDCSGKIIFERNAKDLEIGGNINTNAVEFHNTVTLKSGAKLIIGKGE